MPWDTETATTTGTALPVEMRWLMLLYIIWDLHPVLLALAGDQVFTGIAHAAHLGGAPLGFAYYKLNFRIEAAFEKVPWPGWKRTRRPRLRLVRAPEDIPTRRRRPTTR